MEKHSFPYYESLENFFGEISDPRDSSRTYHDMLDIIGLTIMGLLAGANTWVDIELYGKSCLSWLKEFLPLRNGIPSHDTLGRFFSAVDPASLERSFFEWVKSLGQLSEGLQISIDGKVIRGSHDKQREKKPIHMVSAWVNGLQLSLAQLKVSDKSNEVDAIQKLLELLDVKQQIVSIDAMGTQKSIATKIVDKGGDYILALKQNHPTLYQEVQSTFRHLKGTSPSYVRSYEQWDKAHGRIEHRQCWLLDLTAPDFDWIDRQDLAAWPELRTLVMVEATTEAAGQRQTTQRYYLSSLPASRGAEVFNKYIRHHWTIENCLHWVLDVHFKEDQSRVRTGHADQNLAILRRLALNILRADSSSKTSLRGRRKKAGWDPNYLLELLQKFASHPT